MTTRKALLVGVDDYAPIGSGGPDLAGCVNDTRDMASTLSTLGIVPANPYNMRILTNRRATRAAILNGLKWLVTGAKKGDTLIFYYSGHGSYTTDLNGDELDRRDETICPHDYASAGMIADDDLAQVIAMVPEGANLEVILDSCHSGTATRLAPLRTIGADEVMTLATHPHELVQLTASHGNGAPVIRFVEPPLDVGFFIDASPTLPTRRLGQLASLVKGGKGSKQPVPVDSMNHSLWSACRDFETAAEVTIGGIRRGIFTYHFCRSLRMLGTSVTRLKLDSAVCTELKRLGFVQVPQIEGTPARLNERVFA
jgi:hypothetical protein